MADSAQEARQAYRRAVEAYRRNDLAAARAEMRRAATAWPAQPVYVYGAASLAAQAADSSEAFQWLERYAALGASRDLSADSGFTPLAGNRHYQALARDIAANGAPLVRSTVAFTIPDSMFHAEGVAWDARRRRWLVGSVAQRRIVQVDDQGRVSDFVAPGAYGLMSVLGMAVDARRGLLWVATSALPRMQGFAAGDSGRTGLIAFDLASGRRTRQAWLPHVEGRHMLGDIAVAPNGDVYASDTKYPAIFRLRPSSKLLERVVAHPLIRSPQGIVVDSVSGTLYVADYSHGLLRVDLRSREVRAVAAPAGTTVLGIDGLYRHGRSLVAIQNGVTPPRVVRLTLDRTGNLLSQVEVIDRHLPLADEPTLGTMVGDSLFYIAASQWEKLDDSGKPVTGAALRPVNVLRLPLAELPR